MPLVRIVTDSSAQFRHPDFPQQHNVAVLPLTIHFGHQVFREGVDMDGPRFVERALHGRDLPVVASPPTDQFVAVYADLCKANDQILSIHSSSKLGRTWRNAKAAAEALLGRCTVVNIDSLSLSVGLGWIVERAALAAEAGEPMEEIVRIVRGMVHRLYGVFSVETLAYLEKVGRIGPAQSLLGSMLGIKPLLTLEEGDLVPMEKVRSRMQAIEKLSEFVAEFSSIERLAILHMDSGPTEDARRLLERLTLNYPAHRLEVVPYGPSAATFIGPDGTGVMVLEGEPEP